MGIVVAVGSLNPVKVRGVELVFKRYYDAKVVPLKVGSGVGPQPAGFNVFKGALKRALEARRSSGGQASFYVGIESGPIEFAGLAYLETQVAFILDQDDRVSMGVSSSFPLPWKVLERVLGGEELSRASGIERPGDLGEGIGFIGYASQGLITRLDLTVQAVASAILPFVNGWETMKLGEVLSKMRLE